MHFQRVLPWLLAIIMPGTISQAFSPRFFDIASAPDPQFYSHGVTVDGNSRLVYASGQVGQAMNGSFPRDLKEETRVVFQNLANVFHAGGADVRSVIKLTFLIVESELDQLNSFLEPLMEFLMAEYGIRARPTTTLISVPKLADPHARVEIEGIAAVAGQSQVWTDQGKLLDRTPGPAQVDVVVVGGGFSGVQAAYDVHQAGHSILLLEAKNRIGGRSHTIQLKNGRGITELGATWITNDTQPKIFALTKQLGLQTVVQPSQTQDAIFQLSNAALTRVKPDEFPTFPDSVPGDLMKALGYVTAEAKKVNIHNPTNGSDYRTDVSFEQWMQGKDITDESREYLRFASIGLVGREPRDVGVQYLLDYIKSGGGLQHLAGEGKGTAQALKIKTGTSSIATGLAKLLPAGSFLLNSPVQNVNQHNGSGVVVETTNGFKVQAKKVIFAIPTNTYSDISFSPSLPKGKRALCSHTKPGVYAKAVITYTQPWWHNLNLSGGFTSLHGPINFSWQLLDHENKLYSLALFIAGDSAAKWADLSSLERESALLDHLVSMVGTEHEDVIQNPVEINWRDWTHESWIGGAPTSAISAGDLARYGKALREPHGNLHFGGGETAYEWKGYMEGALTAGSRVAEEVVKGLAGDQRGGQAPLQSILLDSCR